MQTITESYQSALYRFSTTGDPSVEAKIEYINTNRCPDAELETVVECINREVDGNHEDRNAPDWYRVAVIRTDDTDGGDEGEQ